MRQLWGDARSHLQFPLPPLQHDHAFVAGHQQTEGKPGPAVLLWDDAGFSGPLKAENADVFINTKDTYKDAPGFYATDATFKSGRLLTDTNPQQKDFLWSSGSRTGGVAAGVRARLRLVARGAIPGRADVGDK